MFNIGFGELAIICIVLIIAVGPERLPSMMKTLGRTIRTLRQASRDIRASTGIDELLREDFDLYTPPPPPRRPAIVPSTTHDPVEPAPVSRQDPIEPPATPAAAATPAEPAPVEAALLGGAAPQPVMPKIMPSETSSTRGTAEPDSGREPTGNWHPSTAPPAPEPTPAAPAPAAEPHPDQPKQPGS